MSNITRNHSEGGWADRRVYASSEQLLRTCVPIIHRVLRPTKAGSIYTYYQHVPNTIGIREAMERPYETMKRTKKTMRILKEKVWTFVSVPVRFVSVPVRYPRFVMLKKKIWGRYACCRLFSDKLILWQFLCFSTCNLYKHNNYSSILQLHISHRSYI